MPKAQWLNDLICFVRYPWTEQNVVKDSVVEDLKIPKNSDVVVTFKRFKQKYAAIISEVSINGEFICYCLEDAKREVKIWGATAIPAGRYRVDLRGFGGFHERHRHHVRYEGGYMGMLWLRNVANFENILVHKGNWRIDTKGCLLLGETHTEKVIRGKRELWLNNSTSAYHRFYDLVKHAAFDYSLWFEIIDGPEIEAIV